MKKKIYYTLGAIILTITLLTILLSKNGYVLKDGKSRVNNFGVISLMLETAVNSGEYEVNDLSNWPTSGYVYNAEKSGCENGGVLTYNKATNKVTIKNNKSDKCYVYFDVKIPDIIVTANNIPTTVGLLGTINCTGATSTYNSKYNRIEVSALSSTSASCNLNYAERTSTTTLANKVINLSGTTQGTGSVVNEKGYRYEGQDPNNYVWFNNELWRIIGVFDASSHGVASTNLVKIIRNEPIGWLVWDKSGNNNWSVSSLKALLNNEYLNSQDGTNGANCYGYSTIAKSKCNYTTTGIKDAYRGMIKEVTWYLGGLSNTSGDTNYYQTTVENYYKYERDATSKNSLNPSSYESKIGVMYASDYGYAVPSTNCARTMNLGAFSGTNTYINVDCTLNNWLYANGMEWTITNVSSSTSTIFGIHTNGNISPIVSGAYSVRPTLYLDYNVYVLDGNGSKSNPYMIGM